MAGKLGEMENLSRQTWNQKKKKPENITTDTKAVSLRALTNKTQYI